ncbi:hypothetical protein ATM17_23780 [Sphingopyxis macrogoltabida]|uniref:Uncharacterized protein n=1 Tax=Sphingopyxis macrogoltabida TaxID=33050 RepID=A0AAC9FGX8_SPHMC|nr:hypothetical protein LH19_23220 [Sphingopyxis macrogoltabida]AMU92038.1 hypothetical protein ATM17_23780 [Sphingopyxis macrogoltabida]
MEGAVIAGLISLAIGAVALLAGWNHWRYRKQETINFLEAAILRPTGEAPLPLTKLDWFLKYLQAVLGFILGPLFILAGVAIILGELELL